jgi:hypothetical protein
MTDTQITNILALAVDYKEGKCELAIIADYLERIKETEHQKGK